MGFLATITAAKENLSSVTSKVGGMVTDITDKVGGMFGSDEKEQEKEANTEVEKAAEPISEKQDENTSSQDSESMNEKINKVMDWAYGVSNGNIPGLGTSHDMVQRYLDKYGNVSSAIDHMVNWQIAAAATEGFVTSLGGIATLPVLLPANIASVMVTQMRMVGAIAEMGGYEEESEEKKTGVYLCLLGSQAAGALAKTAGQVAIKLSTSALKKLPGTILVKINQSVGFRLVTKFGEKGLVNLCKAVPFIGGIVGGSVDAISTYAIAKTAKAMFLNEIIDSEKQEQIEVDKMRILINMALVDGGYDKKEAELLKIIAGSLNISDKALSMLTSEIDHPKVHKVDLSPFKDDFMYSSTLIAGLSQIAKADGTIHPAEKMYITSLAKELGQPELVADL